MRQVARFLGVILLIAFSPLAACEWCDGTKDFKADCFDEFAMTTKDYYFDYMLSMCPIAADKGLQYLVEHKRYDPQRWLNRDNKVFTKGEGWEPVLKELGDLCSLIEHTYVREDDTLEYVDKIGYGRRRKNALKAIWKQQNCHFYELLGAFRLDYLNDFALEAIKQGDLRTFDRYKRAFEQSLRFIQGSSQFEKKYKDANTRLRELRTILRKSIMPGLSSFDTDDEMSLEPMGF